jgi:hypothetical protein
MLNETRIFSWIKIPSLTMLTASRLFRNEMSRSYCCVAPSEVRLKKQYFFINHRIIFIF